MRYFCTTPVYLTSCLFGLLGGKQSQMLVLAPLTFIFLKYSRLTRSLALITLDLGDSKWTWK